eukprot:15129610-Alexandrium_andersonii.AAC.1
MSASLVGSEMCIRDSPRAGAFCASDVPIKAEGPRGHSNGVRNNSMRYSAVSYTHLTLPTICSV